MCSISSLTMFSLNTSISLSEDNHGISTDAWRNIAIWQTKILVGYSAISIEVKHVLVSISTFYKRHHKNVSSSNNVQTQVVHEKSDKQFLHLNTVWFSLLRYFYERVENNHLHIRGLSFCNVNFTCVTVRHLGVAILMAQP